MRSFWVKNDDSLCHLVSIVCGQVHVDVASADVGVQEEPVCPDGLRVGVDCLAELPLLVVAQPQCMAYARTCAAKKNTIKKIETNINMQQLYQH